MSDIKCTRCGQIKPIMNFVNDNDAMDGLWHTCGMCRSSGKTYRSKHKEQRAEYAKKYKNTHKEYFKQYNKKWQAEHRKELNKRYSLSRVKNLERYRAYNKRANTKLRATPKGRLGHNMGSGIIKSLRQGLKGKRHWEELVGYTAGQLKKHLEKQFKNGMTWGNYGVVWEIDHKIPVAVFNYETPDDIDFRICWSLDNIQPLERFKNRSKQARIDKSFQPSLAITRG